MPVPLSRQTAGPFVRSLTRRRRCAIYRSDVIAEEFVTFEFDIIARIQCLLGITDVVVDGHDQVVQR
jgi:hypothetical protein